MKTEETNSPDCQWALILKRNQHLIYLAHLILYYIARKEV